MPQPLVSPTIPISRDQPLSASSYQAFGDFKPVQVLSQRRRLDLSRDNGWYVTHTGLLGLARRHRCAGARIFATYYEDFARAFLRLLL